MDYEKEYKQALERAIQWANGEHPECFSEARKALDFIFPKLREGEDERFRKYILQCCEETIQVDDRGLELSMDTTKKLKSWLEKQGNEPNWCHHKVDLSNYSEEYRKAYYDGWNNCNMQHSQCKSELDDVLKCLINGMKFYYEDNKDATWGTDKWSMPVKHIVEVLEKQGEHKDPCNDCNEPSEDEKIMKELADFIYVTVFPTKDIKKKERFLSWLEKQQGEKDRLIEELGEYKVKYTQETLGKYLKDMSNNKDNERLRKTTITFLKEYADKGYENAVECIDWIEKQDKRSLVNYEESEQEKSDYVSGQFLYCKGSFNEFKEGQSYWLEYVGDDNYIGRSDNILNEKFHITPKQLYRLFSQQHSPKKDSNVNDETNAPTGYGKYVDECLNEAAKHFFSEGEDKYSVADLFYAGVRCGKDVSQKQGEPIKIKKGKNYLCTKTHKYAGLEWIEGVKYYSPEDYSLVNQGCTCYCPKYSKEEHNNFFREVEKVESHFHVEKGKWYVCIKNNVGMTKGNVYYGISDRYIIDDVDKKYNCNNWAVFQKYLKPWTVEDAKDGDVLVGNCCGTIICKVYNEYETQSYCRFDGYRFIPHEEKGWEATSLVPATKEQRETLFKAIHEAGYEWNSKKKELKEVEQKPAIQPKFGIGDEISKKHNSDINKFGRFLITDIIDGKYWCNDHAVCDISEQDEWELVEQKSSGQTEEGEKVENQTPVPHEKWSEEDKAMLQYTLIDLNYLRALEKLNKSCDARAEQVEKEIQWLKDLKDRIVT